MVQVMRWSNLPKSVGESRIFINSIENLKDLEKVIVEAYDFVK